MIKYFSLVAGGIKLSFMAMELKPNMILDAMGFPNHPNCLNLILTTLNNIRPLNINRFQSQWNPLDWEIPIIKVFHMYIYDRWKDFDDVNVVTYDNNKFIVHRRD